MLERDGAVCVRGLLNSRWQQELGVLFDTLVTRGRDLSAYYGVDESGVPGAVKGRTVLSECCWRSEPKFLEFLQASPLARAAAELMDSATITLYEDLLILKSAGADQPTPGTRMSLSGPCRPANGQCVVLLNGRRPRPAR